jgi:hypothetical protein
MAELYDKRQHLGTHELFAPECLATRIAVHLNTDTVFARSMPHALSFISDPLSDR